jgi:hypothetical protein
MYSDEDLLSFIPSKQKSILNQAIGLRLIDIERFFCADVSSFLKYTSFTEEDYFSHNSGTVQFVFEDSLNHSFAVYGEQLSIVLLPEVLTATEFDPCYKLSEISPSLSKDLSNYLGQVCSDVRIWKLLEDFESEEAKEVAVSYLFSNNDELFYCIYLHEDLSSDYLIPRQNIDFNKVASCFSIASRSYIDFNI